MTHARSCDYRIRPDSDQDHTCSVWRGNTRVASYFTSRTAAQRWIDNNS